jgi:hypothetical protein
MLNGKWLDRVAGARRDGLPAMATRSLIPRAGPVLAAIMLPLALGSCGVFPDAGSGHHRLDRFRSGQCRAGDPLDGVYLPSRLHVKKHCVTVIGSVDCVRREPDGDVHIELRLSGADRRLLRPANAYQRCPRHRGPHLVVEIILQNGELPFPDNSATRAGFVTPRAPRPGSASRSPGRVWVIAPISCGFRALTGMPDL